MSDEARILIVDDSRIFRAALEAALGGQNGITVVGSVFSGTKALEFIRAKPPDLVTLDVEMPGMDGLQTLKAIQEVNATRAPGTEIGVIMVSSFTRRGGEVTMRALEAGAFDFVTKPAGASVDSSLEQLRQDLVPKIRLFVAQRNRRLVRPPTPLPAGPARPIIPPQGGISGEVPLRSCRIRAILVAASTGGPRALGILLPNLCHRVEVPVFVVQHMPSDFIDSLAEQLARQTGRAVVVAGDGQVVRARTIYLAPGLRHLVLRADAAGQLLTGWSEQPPEAGCRPSANVLFRAAAAAIGGGTVAVVLTGMGNDGVTGLGPLKRAGGYAIVQDEETSVVWGMPGSVVEAGLADAVLPLGGIAAAVESLVNQRRTTP